MGKKNIKQRKLTVSRKKFIAGNQYYKCANEPGSKINALKGYDCPLWNSKNAKIEGCFDASGYEIDHITEHCIDQNDDDDNLQALCKMCHSFKTKKFLRNRQMPKHKNNNNYETDNDESDDETDNDETDNETDNDESDDEYENTISKHTSNIINPDRYKCSRCFKNFHKKSNLEDHLNRKNPCDPTKEMYKIKCKYCGKLYTRKYTLDRHIKTIHSKNINQIKLTNDNNYYNGIVTLPL